MDYQEKEKYSGVYTKAGSEHDGMTVRFNRVWSSHRFTDEECRMLLAGKDLEFPMTSRKGTPYTARGRLMEQEFNGHKFWGFKLCDDVMPSSLKGHVFTEDEKAALESGLWVEASDFVSTKSGKAYTAKVKWQAKDGGGMEFKWQFPNSGEK